MGPVVADLSLKAFALESLTPLQKLAAAPLNGNAIANSPLAVGLDDNPGAQTFLKYLLQCALPEETTIDVPGTKVSFKGAAGLAPQWLSAPCGEACQEWVSACILARTNTYTIPVRVYMIGPHPKLGDIGPAGAAYSVDEGAFWGNLFSPISRQYACRGKGYDPIYNTVRVCTAPGNLCGIQVVGPCGGKKGKGNVCESLKDGIYSDCHNRLDRPGTEDKPDKTWTRIVTVRVRKSAMAGGEKAPCGGVKPIAWPPKQQPSGVGTACATDDGCIGKGLFCDARRPPGLCTRACEDVSFQKLEQNACGGPKTTCLSASRDLGSCTKRCQPYAKDACDPGLMCTGLWVFRSKPDAHGCFPWCNKDSDCPVGSKCNPRSGSCGRLPPKEYLADGEPCQLPPTGSGIVGPPCKGACFRVTKDPTQGMCASMIDLAENSGCYRPEVTPTKAQNDELGICLYRACEKDAECTKPLTCQFAQAVSAKRCLYPGST